MPFQTLRRVSLCVSASVAIVALPFASVRAYTLTSAVPSVNVAPGMTNALVMDVTLPQIQPDTRVAGGGVNPPDLAAGDTLYDITATHKISTDSLAAPTKIWVDTDKSGKYTGAHAAGSSVQLGQGDVNLTLTPANGLPGYSSTGFGTQHIYRDTGAVPGYIDTADQKVSSAETVLQEWFTNQQMSGLDLYQLKQQNQLTLCPSGFALGDKIRVQTNANQNLIEIGGIAATPAVNGNYCTLQIEIKTAYPYTYHVGENITRSSVSMDPVVTVLDDATGGIPNQATTLLRVASGTVRGVAIGDGFAVESGADPGIFIVYLVTSVSSYTNKIGVQYVSKNGNLHAGVFRIIHHEQTPNLTGSLTAHLNATTKVKFSDFDSDGAQDANETVYIDSDTSNTVTVGDERVTAITAEPVVLEAPADGALGTSVVTANQQAGQKWRRQSYVTTAGGITIPPSFKVFTLGDDLVIDRDNDSFYQRDVLLTMTVDNTGTAVDSTDIARVRVYLESSGQAGFQTNDTLLGTGVMRQGNIKRWDITPSPSKVLTGIPRFYVTADIAAGAGNGKTLTFGFPFASMVFTTSNTQQPTQAMTNTGTQTISVAAPPPDNTPPVIQQFNRTELTATSVSYHFRADEDVWESLRCTRVGGGSDSASNPNVFKLEGTISVRSLSPNTAYDCTLTLTNRANLTASIADQRFTTPAEVDATAPHLVDVSLAALAATSVTYHFTTDEPVQSAITCQASNDSQAQQSNALSQDVTMTVANLKAQTTYTCEITIVDAVGNRTAVSQPPFETLSQNAPPQQEPSPQLSTVVANPERVTVDGTSVTTITVTLRDQNGAAVSGRTVSLRKVRATVAGTGDVVASSVSDGNGQVPFQERSDVADTYLYTAYVGNTLIGSSQVTFVESGGGGGGGEKPSTPPEVIATFTQCTPLTPASCDEVLARRLIGRIILAVERSGEAFYRYPGDLKAYYLGRPAQAFSIMRFMGSGISNKDITRLFVNFSTPDPGALAVFETKNQALAQRFSGRIILQVEAHGEAYYIHPVTLRGYYLGRPVDAFRIMREQGLGISNSDLAKLELVSAPEGRR